MKNLKTYIPSLLLSILLTLALLGASALAMINGIADPTNMTALVKEKNIVSMTKTHLSNYFEDKYNETGVPADVYTASLTDEYIEKVIERNISAGFEKMHGNEFNNRSGIDNPQLESDIEEFFSSYADSIGYVKDEVYNQKLQQAIDSAYKVIIESCDVYKFQTMNNEGIFSKAGGIYRNLGKITAAAAGVSLLIIVIILLVNIKSVSSVLYWTGISALVSGIIGIVPCIYLNATNYFNAFVIKQPQIFTSFTSLMYKAVDSFMMNQIILAAVGAVMIIMFAVMPKKQEKA